MKIIHALEDSNILLKGISKTNKNDIKEQNGNGLGMNLGTLGASLLDNLLSGKGMYRTGSGDNKCDCEKKKIHYWREGMYRSGEGIKKNV